MTTSVSQATTERLKNTFATHGLPEIFVSDNASCFMSEEFEVFMKKNGIRHVISAPYHPATNGCAERAVQTFKAALKKMKCSRSLNNYDLGESIFVSLQDYTSYKDRSITRLATSLFPDNTK